MKKAAKRMHNHRELILNLIRADGRHSSIIVEEFNSKVKLTTITTNDFKSYHIIEIVRYHAIGAFAEPKTTH